MVGVGRGEGAGDGRGQVGDAHADAGDGGGASAVAGQRQLDAAARALELVGSLVALLGVVLYKVMAFTMLARATLGDERVGMERAEGELVDVLPVRRGFGGFRGELLRPVVRREPFVASPWFPSSTSTWIAYLSLVGSWCWVLGSARAASRGFGGADGVVDPGIGSGLADSLFWFLGSLLFTAQSLLMVHEIAENEEENGCGRSRCGGRGGRRRARGEGETYDESIELVDAVCGREKFLKLFAKSRRRATPLRARATLRPR